MAITIERIGRRSYIRGDTYPLKDAIRERNGHWDPEQRAWWVSQPAVADEIAALAASTPTTTKGSDQAPRDGTASVVAGRAQYQGRSYYLAGRRVRGRTRWDDRVDAITSRDGTQVLLYYRDGSRQFWAPVARYTGQVVRVDSAPDVPGAVITQHYDRPQTIAGLARYAAQARDGFPGRPTCGMCGSPSCDGALGHLCQED